MKTIKLFLFTLLLMFIPTLLIAQSDTEPDFSNPSSIITWLMPLVVLGATHLSKLVLPIIPGWAKMIIVTLISAVITWLTNLAATPDLSFTLQFAYGLLAVFIHQFYKQIKNT